MAPTKSASSGQRPGSATKTRRSRAKPKGTRSTSGAKGLVGKSKAAGESVEETAKESGRAVGRAASKAKVPLVASGTALAGLAGGAALTARRGSSHRGLGAVKSKLASKDLAKA